MPKSPFLLLMLLFSASFSHAQDKLSDNIFLKKLHNGLEVLVLEDHTTPITTLLMTFKAGAFTESADNSGLTGLYTHMLLMGNKDYTDEQDLDYNAGRLGIKLFRSVSSEEYSTVSLTLPQTNFEAGLNYMNSVIRFASLNQGEFDKEKEITSQQLKQKESSPGFLLFNTMIRHLWGDLSNRKTAVGTHETISAATTEMLKVIKGRYFYPNNALFIVAGDVAHTEVFNKVEKIYGDWVPSGFDPFKNWPVPEFKPLVKTDYFIVESQLSRSPSISICWQGPDTRAGNVQSTYAADVFSYIINQNSSKLSIGLIQSGLATSMTMGYLTLRHVGPITLNITPNPAKIKECMAEVKKQIALMDDGTYFTAEQIETARRMLEIKGTREEDITTDYVHSLSFWWASASFNYLLGYSNNLNKVSKADLKNFVQKYIKGKPYCAGLLIDPDLRAQIKADDFFKADN